MNFFGKKLAEKSKSLIEAVTSSDQLRAAINQVRSLKEDSVIIGGYVTVIKNKGREDEEIIQVDMPNLLTTSGRDFFHAQLYTNTSVGTKGANAIAISDNAVNPVAGDTTLVGEITTGGLTRVQAATITHVAGTNVTTLENVFTATAIFTALHKSGLFNQNTIGGQMTQAREFSADVNLQVSDTVTITWTLTTG